MIKLFEMFAGYGGASFSLKKAGIDFECVGYSEIDKYAIQCYEQNHKGGNYGDATKINPNDLPDFDLLTGGFPCQSFSVAGKGLGEQDTRGTLFHEIIRIAEFKRPKYMLLENVKGLTFKPHKKTFEKILSELDRIGYDVFYKVLNSKDYGIPQNRERIFFVCFHRSLEDNQDLIFKFPEKEELKILLKDILEEEVEEKYYLSEKALKRLLTNERAFNERMCKTECSPALCARDYKDPKCIRLDEQEGRDREIKRIYHPNGISPTLHQKTGGWQEVKIAIPTLTPFRKDKRQNGRRFKEDGEPMFTLTGQDIHGIYNGKIIRNLTPFEYFRLMGFQKDEINLEGISNTRRYNLAGNGWDINLVSKIFQKMFNVIVPHTNFPSEFSENGKRHNTGLEVTSATHSPPKEFSTKIPSPNPNIKLNRGFVLQAL